MRGKSTGVFVSDFHLFSPRSDKSLDVIELLRPYRSTDNLIVLGGDVFDFRWSDRGSFEKTLTAAKKWLSDLLEATGQSRIHYLLGNHDCHTNFARELENLASREPRFAWSQHHWQLGNNLFLHGDILDSGSLEGVASYRSKFQSEETRSWFAHRAYDLVVMLRLHRTVPGLRHKPAETCKLLARAIPDLDKIESQQVKRVYFGHTHVRIDGLEYNGIRFFNPGAALKHVPFEPVEFEF